MTARRVAWLLVTGAFVGFSIFGVLVYRASSVEYLDSPDALRRFSAIRAAMGTAEPLLTLDDQGRVVRRREPSAGPKPPAPSRLKVYAYQSGPKRLVSSDIPFWFFKIKGPAARLALSSTGLDLERLQVTPADLERHGAGVVIDHARTNGDRLLVWTE